MAEFRGSLSERSCYRPPYSQWTVAMLLLFAVSLLQSVVVGSPPPILECSPISVNGTTVLAGSNEICGLSPDTVFLPWISCERELPQNLQSSDISIGCIYNEWSYTPSATGFSPIFVEDSEDDDDHDARDANYTDLLSPWNDRLRSLPGAASILTFDTSPLQLTEVKYNSKDMQYLHNDTQLPHFLKFLAMNASICRELVDIWNRNMYSGCNQETEYCDVNRVYRACSSGSTQEAPSCCRPRTVCNKTEAAFSNGNYWEDTQCQAHVRCNYTYQYMKVQPNATYTGLCENVLPSCVSERTFQLRAPTRSTNRVCKTCTQCPDSSISESCTTEHDTVCASSHIILETVIPAVLVFLFLALLFIYWRKMKQNMRNLRGSPIVFASGPVDDWDELGPKMVDQINSGINRGIELTLKYNGVVAAGDKEDALNAQILERKAGWKEAWTGKVDQAFKLLCTKHPNCKINIISVKGGPACAWEREQLLNAFTVTRAPYFCVQCFDTYDEYEVWLETTFSDAPKRGRRKPHAEDSAVLLLEHMQTKEKDQQHDLSYAVGSD